MDTNYVKTEQSSRELFLPFTLMAAIIGFIPFMVFLRVVEYGSLFKEIYGQDVGANYFTFYRAVWLGLFSFAGMVWFAVNKKGQTSWYHKPAAVYCFFAIASTALSYYPDIALWGSPIKREGLLIHLAYMATFFLFSSLILSKKHIKLFVTVLLVSAGLLSVLGVAQYLGYDYFHSEFTHTWLTSHFVYEANPGLTFSSAGSSPDKIFLTFGNSNITGTYMTMLFIFSMVLCLSVPAKWTYRLMPINILIYMNLLCSKSRGAFLGAAVAGLIVLFIIRKKLVLKTTLIFFAAYIVTFIAFDSYTLHTGRQRFFRSTVGRSVIGRPTRSSGNFNDLILDGDSVFVVFDCVKLEARHVDGEIIFFDSEGKEVRYRALKYMRDDQLENEQNDDPSAYKLLFPPGEMEDYRVITMPEMRLLRIDRGSTRVDLVYTENGFRLVGPFGKPQEIKEVESWGFDGRERFGSARGYIWSRSLPLLRHTLLVGHGPDTFALHFPNHDYLGKLRHVRRGIAWMVDKPHNLFIQTGVNVGVVAMLAMMIMFFVYIWQSTKYYYRNFSSSFTHSVGVSILGGVIAYLISVLFTDSTVSVTPVFWGIFGLGVATNRENEKTRTKNKELRTKDQ